MKNIMLTLGLATAAMAVASVSHPAIHAQQISVFNAKGVAAAPAGAAVKAQRELALAQIECCDDPFPTCPPICAPPPPGGDGSNQK